MGIARTGEPASNSMLLTTTVAAVAPNPPVGHKIPCRDEAHSCTYPGPPTPSRAVAIEDVPMDTLVDNLSAHMRLVQIGIIAQVCVGLRAATRCHVELPARACAGLRMWRATARLHFTCWQTVMMWRQNASRVADAEFEATIMEELEDMMKQDTLDDSADITDEEAEFLEHHMMKQAWERVALRLADEHRARTIGA